MLEPMTALRLVLFLGIPAVFVECSCSAGAPVPTSSPGAAAQVCKVALEGNIAAGKSTLLRLLEDEVGYIAVPEPISKWQSVSPSGPKSCGVRNPAPPACDQSGCRMCSSTPALTSSCALVSSANPHLPALPTLTHGRPSHPRPSHAQSSTLFVCVRARVCVRACVRAWAARHCCDQCSLRSARISSCANQLPREPGARSSPQGNLLELFYKDPKRWGYTFQTYAFLSRCRRRHFFLPQLLLRA